MSGRASECRRTTCLHYLSPLEFFFYCCCGIDFEDCAYTDDRKILSYASINAEAWKSRSEIRSFYKPDGREFENRTDIYGRPWLYRKFIYSLPVVDENTKKVVHSMRNIRVNLCAVGEYNVTIGEWQKYIYLPTPTRRSFLPKPHQFCVFEASFYFEN
ncbi:unnamed protein product, partial [Gongylonema pulchrum]|uniref:F5/8 type C domain-containing protein n=1 Tax=Gongylonema pulchrum TaxID=637853 RepID=A0A183D5V8_9BILA